MIAASIAVVSFSGCASSESASASAVPLSAADFKRAENDPAQSSPLVFVSDVVGGTVNIYDIHGTPKAQLGGFSVPTGVAVGPNRDLYVVDSGNHAVKIFKAPYDQPPTVRKEPGPIVSDVNVSATGLIAIVKRGESSSVSFYRDATAPPCKTLAGIPLYADFSTFDANGTLYVDGLAGRSDRVAIIAGGCDATAVSVQLAPHLQGQVGGIAVNANGQVIIADTSTSTIYTYDRTKSGGLSLDITTTLVDTSAVWGIVLTPGGTSVLVAGNGIQGSGSGWKRYAYPFAHSPTLSVMGLSEAFGIAMTPPAAP